MTEYGRCFGIRRNLPAALSFCEGPQFSGNHSCVSESTDSVYGNFDARRKLRVAKAICKSIRKTENSAEQRPSTHWHAECFKRTAMKKKQTNGPGKSHDDSVNCDTCGCVGEARRASPISDLPSSDWLQPPTGWWVLLNESNHRVRCPECLDLSGQVPEPQPTSSIMNKPAAKTTVST